METVTYFIFLGYKIIADGDCSYEVKTRLHSPWKKSYDKTKQHVKKQRDYFANKGPSSQSYGFFQSLNSTELSCLGDLLPVPSWFSVRNVIYVDVFLMYLWEEVSSIFSYSTILITLLI